MVTVAKQKKIKRQFINSCLKAGIQDADMMVSMVRDINQKSLPAYKAHRTMGKR